MQLYSDVRCFENRIVWFNSTMKILLLASLWDKTLNEYCVEQASGWATTVFNVTNNDSVACSFQSLKAYIYI